MLDFPLSITFLEYKKYAGLLFIAPLSIVRRAKLRLNIIAPSMGLLNTNTLRNICMDKPDAKHNTILDQELSKSPLDARNRKKNSGGVGRRYRLECA